MLHSSALDASCSITVFFHHLPPSHVPFQYSVTRAAETTQAKEIPQQQVTARIVLEEAETAASQQQLVRTRAATGQKIAAILSPASESRNRNRGKIGPLGALSFLLCTPLAESNSRASLVGSNGYHFQSSQKPYTSKNPMTAALSLEHSGVAIQGASGETRWPREDGTICPFVCCFSPVS